MDGVIVNSEPIHQQLEWEMFAELGLDISDEEHKSFIGTSSMDMWNRIKQNHHLDKTPEELLFYGRQKYWDAIDSGKVQLVDGVFPLIKTLKNAGFIIQVASSATRPTVDKVLQHFDLEQYFQYRIGGDEVTKSKPEPEIFLKAAGLSGTPPAECLVIEDATNGVRAAKAAGMYCIAYENENTGEQDLSMADLVIIDLSVITPDLIGSL